MDNTLLVGTIIQITGMMVSDGYFSLDSFSCLTAQLLFAASWLEDVPKEEEIGKYTPMNRLTHMMPHNVE